MPDMPLGREGMLQVPNTSAMGTNAGTSAFHYLTRRGRAVASYTCTRRPFRSLSPDTCELLSVNGSVLSSLVGL